MSNAEAKNDKRAGEQEDRPTASFSGSAPGSQDDQKKELFLVDRSFDCAQGKR